MDALFREGYVRPLGSDDITSPPNRISSTECTKRFDEYWKRELALASDSYSPSLSNAVFAMVKWELLKIGTLKVIGDSATVLSPLVLKYFIQYISFSNATQTSDLAQGFIYVLAMFFLSIINTFLFQYYFQSAQVIGMQAQTAVSNLIYRKSLKLSAKSRQNFDGGKVVNMVSTDCARIQQYLLFIDILGTAPIQIVFILAMMVWQIGPAALAGVSLLLLFTPVQGLLFKKLSAVRREIAPITDKRVKLTTEILSGIRIIKFFAWETPFLKKLEEIRRPELRQVMKRSILNAVAMSIVFGIPIFCSTLSFMIYSFYNPLSAEQIFPTLTWFGQLRFPLMFIPNVLIGIAEYRVAITRIQALLLAPELDVQPDVGHDHATAIRISKGEFIWELPATGDETDEKPAKKSGDTAIQTDGESSVKKSTPQRSTLRNINLEIPHGKLVAIVGRVGSGKSSLLNAIIGEMKHVNGDFSLSGTVSYAPQKAWIQNSSVKKNILFGLPEDHAKYVRAIRDCSLEHDLEILPDGDSTEIGERGINLSGGQKQRVNLARCVYVDTSIVLMDDPLSAVDAHVGEELFSNLILDSLSGKTRVLVTHQLHVLPRVDYVVVMSAGEVAEQGTYAELLAANGEFARLMGEYGGVTGGDAVSQTSPSPSTESAILLKDNAANRIGASMAKNDAKPAKELMTAEERNVGSVDSSVWLAYVKATGGLSMVLILALALILAQASKIGNDYWLVAWTNNVIPGFSSTQYIGIFWLFGFGQMISTFTLGLIFTFASVRAAKNLHRQAAFRILRTPISFFDSTPLGRVINRFSKDQDAIDNTLADSVRMFLMTLTAAIGSFVLIIYATPFFAIPIVPLLALYYFMQEVYRSTSRELKRLDSISRSPLYAHFGETIVGLSTIRAYGMTEQFIEICEEKLDNTNGPNFVLLTAQRWLALRLEVIGAFIVFFAATFGVLSRFSISPAIVGLSLSYAIQITGLLSWCVRQFAESEIAMNAVERVNHFGTALDMEAEPIIENSRPPPKWPVTGSVVFEDVSVRYKPDLPLVLKNVNLSINDKNKIGIVGRTGSGKSTMMNSLFRIMELSSGKITIDGLDISSIGLDDLRKALAIIPQDPVLFSGTFRSNLDPFNEHTDADLWFSLERANLKEKVMAEGGRDGLEGVILEGGENLSVGERQLLCLARAILKNSRILVLDEASSNIDYESDAFIQKALREDFKDTTILTIAHRLNTIIDYDTIIVFDNGKIVEAGSPKTLLENANGVFTSLVDDTGKQNADLLKKLAQ